MELFNEFEIIKKYITKNNIKFSVLKNFNNQFEQKKIFLYVDKKFKKKLNKYLLLNGWYHSHSVYDNSVFNTYSKIIDNSICKINIIFEINEKHKGIYNHLKVKIFKIFIYIFMKIRKESIAIIGVDGSGKSTAINAITKIYGSNSQIVYMGLKDFKNKRIENKLKMIEYCSFFDKITLKISLFFEMLKRYFEYRYTSKVIIYDRYVEDYFINSIGKAKFIDRIFYKTIFPKAKLYIYFYCKAETSFSRKDDILDKKAFILMKNRYDAYFKDKKNVIKLNTDEFCQEEIINILCDSINKKIPESII